jgi:thiamine biosynthesis lipoprotein
MIGAADGIVIGVVDSAIATSSTLRRRWRTDRGEAHHIVDPATARPATSGTISAVIIAPDAAFADSLATALVADSVRVLRSLPDIGAEALVQDAAGMWAMTPGVRRYLR